MAEFMMRKYSTLRRGDLRSHRLGSAGSLTMSVSGTSLSESTNYEAGAGMWVVALYDYTAQDDDEISFQEGELLFLTSTEDSAWYEGRGAQGVGVFPSNYVDVVPDEELMDPARKATLKGLLEWRPSFSECKDEDDMMVERLAMRLPCEEWVARPVGLRDGFLYIWAGEEEGEQKEEGGSKEEGEQKEEGEDKEEGSGKTDGEEAMEEDGKAREAREVAPAVRDADNTQEGRDTEAGEGKTESREEARADADGGAKDGEVVATDAQEEAGRATEAEDEAGVPFDGADGEPGPAEQASKILLPGKPGTMIMCVDLYGAVSEDEPLSDRPHSFRVYNLSKWQGLAEVELVFRSDSDAGVSAWHRAIRKCGTPRVRQLIGHHTVDISVSDNAVTEEHKQAKIAQWKGIHSKKPRVTHIANMECSGAMYKQGGNAAWQLRWFALKDNFLYYWDVEESSRFKGCFFVYGAEVKLLGPVGGYDNCICVTAPNQRRPGNSSDEAELTVVLSASSPSEANIWMTVLRAQSTSFVPPPEIGPRPAIQPSLHRSNWKEIYETKPAWVCDDNAWSAQAMMEVKGSRTWVPRWVAVAGNFLYVWDIEESSDFKECIYVYKAVIQALSELEKGHQFCIKICPIVSRNTGKFLHGPSDFLLCASSEEVYLSWYGILCAASENFVVKAPKPRKKVTISEEHRVQWGAIHKNKPPRSAVSDPVVEGYLVKRGNSTGFKKPWDQRWCALKGNFLYYWTPSNKDADIKVSSSSPQGALTTGSMAGCVYVHGADLLELGTVGSHKWCFKLFPIVNRRPDEKKDSFKDFLLSAPDEEDYKGWIAALQAAAETYHEPPKIGAPESEREDDSKTLEDGEYVMPVEHRQEWIYIFMDKPFPNAVRNVAMAGPLSKQGAGGRFGGKSWKERWFALSGYFLYYWTGNKDSSKFKGAVYLGDASVEEIADVGKRTLCFKICPLVARNPDREGKDDMEESKDFVLSAPTQEALHAWINAIRHAAKPKFPK